MQPFLSIVCPTKDRPECIRVLLKSLANQTDSDFEVIVSDNAGRFPCKNVVNGNAGTNIKYYRTKKCLGICDSFEFAISHASGRYVMFVEDKTILYPDAVEKINRVLKKENLDILNFPWDFLAPYEKEKDIISGIQKMALELDKEWNYGAILRGLRRVY